jgi:hypothetical protein
MSSLRSSAGVPKTHRGFLWSKMIDAMVGPSSVANGDLLLRAGGVWTRKAIGTSGQFLKTVSGVPDWAGSGGGGGGDFYDSAYQAADLVITNATTGATFVDTDLVLTLAAGTYVFDFQVFGITNATPVMKQQLHWTGTATYIEYLAALILEADTRYFNDLVEAFETNLPWAGFTGNVMSRFRGTVVVSVAGDLSYQVAQTTAGATSITHHRGSSAIVWKTA